MKLDQIGFYTLSDERAKHASKVSPIWRAEFVITSACNFNCPYCRPIKSKTNMTFDEFKLIFDILADNGVKNIRFTGGEPTLNKDLPKMIQYANTSNTLLEHIAISTNGSKSFDFYKSLVEIGVNDFSISLDSCCSATGDLMSGEKLNTNWQNVVDNIRKLSEITYVTVGIVYNELNSKEVVDTIKYAQTLNIKDIRIIPSAQYNIIDAKLKKDKDIRSIMKKYPILNYRISRIEEGKGIRGLQSSDNHACPLVLDDLVIYNHKHYPCIIYFREGGKEIGEIPSTHKALREQRQAWFNNHNTFNDDICNKNCLDVCCQYNNNYKEFHNEQSL